MIINEIAFIRQLVELILQNKKLYFDRKWYTLGI